METRKQQRAVCPACFGQWAVTGSRIVDHGFEIARFGFRAGRCIGSRRPHFGTVEGRTVAAEIADGIEKHAGDLEKSSAAYARHEGKIFDRRWANGGFETYEVEQPSARQFEARAAVLARDAEHARAEVARRREMIAAWAPAAPVEVAVEVRGPIVHLSSKWGMHTVKACAGSLNGALRGSAALTTDPAAVTCTRCEARIRARAEREARKVQS